MSGSKRTLEADLTCPALDMLDAACGSLSTTALRTALKSTLTLSNGDLMPLAGRTDYKIDQIIRNVVSHKPVPGNIIHDGLVKYTKPPGTRAGLLTITPAGLAYLKANCP